MAEDKTASKLKEVAQDTAATTLAVSGALATVDPNAAAIAVVTGSLFGIMKVGIEYVSRTRTRNAERFVYRLLRSFPEKTPEEVKGLLEAHIEEPFVAETFFESVRRLADTPHECVAEPLAVLAAEYVSAQKEPDWFFKGLARMLTEISAAEFTSLQDLFKCLAEASAGKDDIFMLRLLRMEGESSVVIAHWTLGSSDATEIGRFAHGPRLFNALVRNGLGGDAYFFTVPGAPSSHMSPEVVRRIHNVIR